MECQKATKRSPQGRTGTYAGYAAHRRAGEPLCPACQKAKKDWEVKRHLELPEEKREKARETTRKWRSKHPDYNKEYYRKNREENIRRVREWEKAQGEEGVKLRRKQAKAWRQKNPGRMSEYGRARRAKEKQLPHEDYTLEDIIERYGSDCYLCGYEVDLNNRGLPLNPRTPNVDHVIPISDPECPGDILSNVRVTHYSCNIKKSGRRLEVLDLPFDIPKEEF